MHPKSVINHVGILPRMIWGLKLETDIAAVAGDVPDPLAVFVPNRVVKAGQHPVSWMQHGARWHRAQRLL